MELTFSLWVRLLMQMTSNLFTLSLLTIVSLMKSSLHSILLALSHYRELAVALIPLASNSVVLSAFFSLSIDD